MDIFQVANTTEGTAIKVGFQEWNLEENSTSNVWDDLIKGYYDKIKMNCTGCKQKNLWCNCTLQNIKHEQNYSITIKIEEVKVASTTRVTHCPIKDKNTNFFNCNWPHNASSQILASELCDGHPDCPNKRDEEHCEPNEFLLTFTVIGVFLASSLSAFAWGRCHSKKKASKRSKERPTNASTSMTKALKALHQQLKTTEESTDEAKNIIEMLSEEDKFKLVTIAQKIKVQQSTSLFKEAVAIVFKSQEPEKKSETQDLLNRYKQKNNISTRTKRAAYRQAENGTMYRLASRIQCHIVLRSLAAWTSLLLAEQKDVITIAGIFYFDRQVIFGRYVLLEGVQLNHILTFLIVTYITFALWKMLMCFRTNLPGSPNSGFKMALQAMPFFVETRLILEIYQAKRECLTLEEAISKEAAKDEPDWNLIVSLGERSEEVEKEVEKLVRQKKAIGVTNCISDVLQAACLSCLILRPDLRTRGLFTNKTFQKLFPKLELVVMKLLVLVNLTSPCLRIRSYINGHKQGVFGPAGICLLLSIILNMLPYFVNMVVLGSTSPVLIPTFLVFNSLIVLIIKACIDHNFRGLPVQEQINHILCATLFIVTTRTRKGTTGKDSAREVIFLYLVNLLQWLLSIPPYLIFPGLLQEIDKMKLPVSNSTIIYLIVPMSILLSALLRSVHYMKDGWAFGRQRSCKTISKGFLR